MNAQLSREGEMPTGRLQQSSEATEMSHGRQHGRDSSLWPQGSPSLRGYGVGAGDSQAPTQLNDQPQADDADSHQVMLCLSRIRTAAAFFRALQQSLLASFPLLGAIL